jgi:hypothetical protein
VIADRWGVVDAEVARRYPCDDFVAAPVVQAWRGVTAHVPVERVWPWVAQIQLAPYSYDWIDNRGRRSPREIRGRPDPVVGERFSSALTGPIGQVLRVSPPTEYTGRIAGVVISYVLVPDGDSTRLLMKLVAARGRLLAPALCLGDLVMARRQLLNLKHLAETTSL